MGAERFARLPEGESDEIEPDDDSRDACVARAPSGSGASVPLLFDNYIGRKRDVGGGVLAGLCCLGWFRVNGSGADDGVRRDY